MSPGQQPIIIIGMHRSGTTMITQLLQKMGLFLGWVLQENSEALFFVERNEKLMNVCGGAWDYPQPVENLLVHKKMRELARDQLLRDTRSPKLISYLGPRAYLRHKSLDRIDFAWGWKDPRNTYLLPLWLELFPRARIIHIYRHPMDVAKSLQHREQHALDQRIARISGARELNGTVATRSEYLVPETGLLYVYRRLSGLRERFARLRCYDRLNVPSSLSLDDGVRLWSQYVSKCFELLEALPNASIHVKYEDFLDSPQEHLYQLRDFCNLQGDGQTLQAICRGIHTDRRYAFKKDEEARRAFVAFRSNEWVKRLGYDMT